MGHALLIIVFVQAAAHDFQVDADPVFGRAVFHEDIPEAIWEFPEHDRRVRRKVTFFVGPRGRRRLLEGLIRFSGIDRGRQQMAETTIEGAAVKTRTRARNKA